MAIPASATAATFALNPTSALAAVQAAATETSQDITEQVIADGGISRRGERDPNCADEAKGYGPIPSPDTADAFVAANSGALAGATDATPVPSGYTKVYQGALGQLPAYGWYALKTLQTYDVQQCANYCSGFTACSSFNIFYERIPQQNPSCNANTPSVTQIKCVAHGWNPTSAAQATNKFQWRGSFKTATAGAAAYVQTYSSAPTIDGFTAPKTLADGKCAINAPLDPENKGVDGKYLDTYMGTKLFTNTPFDPSLCTKLCQETTTFNSKNIPTVAEGLYKSCNYVNVFMINKNSQAQGMQCSMYSRDWKAEEDALAVNCGYTDTRWNDKYTITRSTSYAVRPTARTDVATAKGTSSVLTFEADTLKAPDSVMTLDLSANGGLYSSMYGFTLGNNAGVAADDQAGVFTKANTYWTQPVEAGDFGFCNWNDGCTLTAKDFIFDLKSFNFADLARQSGAYTVKGLRAGNVVATFQKSLADGSTLLNNFSGELSDDWKNFNALSFHSPSFAGFDNLSIVKYPVTKKRSLDARATDEEVIIPKTMSFVDYMKNLNANNGTLVL